MNGNAPPDFLQPARGPHRLSWVALAVSLLVLAVASLDALDAFSLRSEAMALPAPAPVVADRSPPPGEAEAGQALWRARGALDRPWPATFAAIEATAVPGVAWLVLDIGDRGSLRLEGLAPDVAAALSAAEILRAQPGWREVLLARIDRTVDGRQSFALVATPAEGAW